MSARAHPTEAVVAARLLLVLTFTSGTVDAVSFLKLGHVFVAAMTGNLLFLAFALAGARGFSATASLIALVAFVVGSMVGGSLVGRTDRLGLIRKAGVVQLVALVIGAAVLGAVPQPSGLEQRLLVAILALAMGAQMTTVRQVGIKEVTTTVLTTTLSTLVSELRSEKWASVSTMLKTAAILAEILGAFVAAVLVLKVAAWVALAVGAAATSMVIVTAQLRRRSSEAASQ